MNFSIIKSLSMKNSSSNTIMLATFVKEIHTSFLFLNISIIWANMENEIQPFSHTNKQYGKIGTVVVFSIILPLVDVITDVHLIIKLYTSDLPNFATMLLGNIVPF